MFSTTTSRVTVAFPTLNVSELPLDRYTLSPLYVTVTVLSPTVRPGTRTLILPSTTPTVLLNSFPTLTVTLPVAPSITVILTNATPPKLMSSTSTVTVD